LVDFRCGAVRLAVARICTGGFSPGRYRVSLPGYGLPPSGEGKWISPLSIKTLLFKMMKSQELFYGCDFGDLAVGRHYLFLIITESLFYFHRDA